MKRIALAALFFLLVGTQYPQVFARNNPITPPGQSASRDPQDVLRDEIQNRLDDAKQRQEDIRGEISQRKEDLENQLNAKRDELRERLQVIKDEKKLVVLERIESMFGRINERRTDHFSRVLRRLSEILDKIQSRTDRVEAGGKDVSKVRGAIATARTAITNAQLVVDVQKEKVYELQVTDESTARNDVGATMKKLQEDLRATRESVHQARTAVFDALRQLVTVQGGGESEATPSATGVLTPTP